MTTYQKIPGPYKRDPKTNQLVVGDWTSEALGALAELPIWTFTEKVDGTNVRVYWDGYRVTWKGRTDNATFSADATKALEERFGGPDNEIFFEQQFGQTPAVLYGELYGPKIQSGGVYRHDISFRLFDVLIGDFWLARPNVEDVAEGIGVEAVPLFEPAENILEAIAHVARGLYSEVAFDEKKDNSVLAEGLVGITSMGLRDRRGDRIIVKVKTRDFYTV